MKSWMLRFFDWLFGTYDTAEILTIRWLFRYQLPLWAGLFILVGIGFYCERIYRREAPFLSRMYRNVLAFLRFLTYVILLIVILKPLLKMDRLTDPRSNLAIVVDTSKSMTIVEKGAPSEYIQMVAHAIDTPMDKVKDLSRKEIVRALLNRKQQNLIEKLREKYSLRFYGFDVQTRLFDVDFKTKTILLPEAKGDETHIGSALRYIAHDLRGLPLAGIVVFTDGGNNGGESPEIVANDFGKKGIRIFPVGIGVPQSVDIKVVDFDIPDLVFKGEDISVEVTFEGHGVFGNSIQVDLSLGGEKIGGDRIEGKDGRFKHTFVIRAREIGDFIFRVAAEEQPNEYFVLNNVKEKRIRVIDNAIRVLFIIENPSWEYRYLKGMLDDDKRVNVKVFIRRGDPRRAQYDPQYLDRIPFESLNKDFDCLIMSNIRADYFDREKMEKIRDFVTKEGGSLIMISATSGTPGTFADTPIGEMLPVYFAPIEEDISLDFADQFTRPFGLKLTREGRYHPITRLVPSVEENEKLWNSLPLHYWYYTGIKKAKPSATVLVEHERVSNEYGPIPLIATHRFGKGQVLFFGINSIWRWRYKVGNKYTNRFWVKTIQFMGLPHLLGSMRRVNIITSEKNYNVGEKIDVTARVLTLNYTPLQDSEVTLVAQNIETLTEQTIKLPKDPNREGFFEGALFLKEGTWQLYLSGYAEEEKVIIDVKTPQYEFENPAMQQTLLETMATSSGGAFFTLKTVDDLPKVLKEKSAFVHSPVEKSIWDTWLMILLLFLTTSLEWFLRKQVDLP